MLQMRPYQEEAKAAIFKAWERGERKTLLVLPTGTGKTIVFASVIAECVKNGDRCLVLAHRGELLDQAADKIHKATGLMCAVEKAEQTSIGTFFQVVVGSVQTLQRESRLLKFPKNYFDTIIIDEAHHAISTSYQAILDYFSSAKVLGVTATPDRGDMQNLGTLFDSLAYEYKLADAIKDGYLAKIKAQMIPLQLDISKVGMQSGDFKAGEIGSALDPYLEQIADEMAKICQSKKTVVFLPLIATSRKFCALLSSRGLSAAEVNGNSPDRAEILKDFENNKYKILCNSMLLTEGWDCPDVDCIVVLRPTKVRSLYAQMVGRGTRLATGKDHVLLLDFLWHTERHDLCRPACLISTSAEVTEKMTKAIEAADVGGEIDLEQAEATAKEEVIADREAALAKQLEEMRKRKRKFVDPLQFAMSIKAEDLASYQPVFAWEMAPPSKGQIEYLENVGIDAAAVKSAGVASKLISRLSMRKVSGLATPKQIRALERLGFRSVGTWSFDAASRMIARISQNSWRVPRGIIPSEYQP